MSTTRKILEYRPFKLEEINKFSEIGGKGNVQPCFMVYRARNVYRSRKM